MKRLNRFSGVIKVLGIVLVCVAIVLGLYAMANTGGPWSSLRSAMNSASRGTGFTDRIRFDDAYFSALSQASSNRDMDADARIEEARGHFRSWFSQLEAADEEKGQEMVSQTLSWLEETFDTGAFLGRLENMEDLQESQENRVIFEYINSIGAPKSGKVAKLQAASQEPFFREFYESFSAEHGEDAGTWLEFMTVVRGMLENAIAGGESIRDVKAWMKDSFTYEAFQEGLATVKATERTELSENFAVRLGELCEKKENGESVDFGALLTETAALLSEKYPGQDLGGNMSTEAALASVLPSLLADDTFDGSYEALGDALRTRAAQDKTLSALSWENQYLNERVLQEADKRAIVSIISGFWWVVARYAQMFLIGVLLLLVAFCLRRLVSMVLIRQRNDREVVRDADVLLRVDHLKQYFKSGSGVTKAVDDISFFIRRGEVFGLVGESGCGKTTTGRTIINLYDPTDGDVYFDGLKISSTQNGLPVLKAQLRQDYSEKITEARKQGDAAGLKQLKKELKEKLRQAEDHALESSVEKSKCVELYREKRLRELREAYEHDAKHLTGSALEERRKRYETEKKVAAKDNVMTRMQMIFQDPIASINPRMTVREIIAEGLTIRGVTDKDYINEKVYQMLELVGLVREHADRYPHEFSGGQRQRIGIARAIIMEPDLIIADEPISALDVSIQAQVINLLNDLRERMGLTIMFIAHNLSVVKYFSDRIAVMYFGHIVEMAPSDELFAHPLHPYTKSLLSAIPYPDPHYEKTRKRLEYNPAKAHDYSKDKPELREIVPGHFIHCNQAEYDAYLREMGQ